MVQAVIQKFLHDNFSYEGERLVDELTQYIYEEKSKSQARGYEMGFDYQKKLNGMEKLNVKIPPYKAETDEV